MHFPFYFSLMIPIHYFLCKICFRQYWTISSEFHFSLVISQHCWKFQQLRTKMNYTEPWIGWASQVVLVVKNPPCQCRRHKRCLFNPRVGRIPWRRAWQPTPAFLPGESHRQRSQVGYGPQGWKEWAQQKQPNTHACRNRSPLTVCGYRLKGVKGRKETETRAKPPQPWVVAFPAFHGANTVTTANVSCLNNIIEVRRGKRCAAVKSQSYSIS